MSRQRGKEGGVGDWSREKLLSLSGKGNTGRKCSGMAGQC